jgi:twinkle protein
MSAAHAVEDTHEVTHQPCPYESCGSSDAFAWNPGKSTGYCFGCSSSYPRPNFRTQIFDWAEETYPVQAIEKPKDQNRPIKSATFKGIRGLDEDVARLYKIQLQLDEDGVPVRYAFKYPNNTKYRGYDEKKFWTEQRGSPKDLFGPDFNAGSSKRLYITEGEFDAASLYQALGKSYPVKSLPSASISEKFIKNVFEYLNSFSEIVYAGEQDEAGKAAANRLYGLFPEKFYYVPLTKHKDANDFITSGDVDDLKWAALKPQRFSPDNFFVGDIEVEKAITTENPYEYVPTGHTGLDDKIRGLVKGGLTFIKALRGQGKTELIRYFEVGLLKSETRIALLHMEEMKSTTYRAMATYELGANVRTKEDAQENGISEDQVIEAAKKAAQDEKTIIFEMQAHDDPMALLEYVRLAATVYGAQFIFIDHVQRLAYLSNAGVEGATSTLTTLGARMAQLAKELDIGVIFISQVNDDGRTKYAASLEEEAIICIKLERDTEAEDEMERNTTNFIVDKNRPFSKLGNAGSVYYDPDTTILEEVSFRV